MKTFRILLDEETSDGGSSTDVTQTEVGETSETAKPAETSSETKITLDSVIADAASKSTASVEGEGPAKELGQTKEDEKEEKVEEESTEEKAESEDVEAKDETQSNEEAEKPVPYTRFNEINSQKVELEKTVEAHKPYVEAQQGIIKHCQDNSITPAQFQFWMDVAAKASTDPMAAVEMVKPVLQQLQSFTGDTLSPDLEKMVADGSVPLDVAKRVAKAENQLKFRQDQLKRNSEQQAQLQQTQAQKDRAAGFHTALVSFITSKQKLDPDFKPKSKPSDVDGSYELFLKELRLNTDSVTDAKSLVKVADDSFNSVKALIKRFGGFSRNGAKHVLSTRSTSTTPAKPKSLDEVIANAAKFGIPGRK